MAVKKTFRLEIHLNNRSMREAAQVARALQVLAGRMQVWNGAPQFNFVEDEHCDGVINDNNRDQVGQWSLDIDDGDLPG